jgi:ribulose-5-phosphate 4-epimerase/fuculose-1-phosphate aldolase
MEVGIDDGEVKSGAGDVERSCYCIHAPIHKALPQAKAVFHTHMPFASALTRLEDPCIKEIGQTEVGMINEIAYDDEYTGPALDPEEGARLARVIGEKSILFMANHGISTVGVTVAEAYDRLYYVERAAQVQIYAMWTGQKLKQLPAPVVAKTKRDIGGGSRYDPPPSQRHFDALKRLLDRKEPDYAIQSISATASVRSAWAELIEANSSVLALRRFNSLIITSPSRVFTTTRSPRWIAALGDTTTTSPSR